MTHLIEPTIPFIITCMHRSSLRTNPQNSSVQTLINTNLNLRPHASNSGVSKRQDLCAHDPSNALLPIAPPVQVRQSGPPPCSIRPPRRTARQHEAEAPALRRPVGKRVDVRDRVRVVRLRVRYALSTKVGQVGDLVPEHLVHGGFFDDFGACLGTGAVVEEDG